VVVIPSGMSLSVGGCLIVIMIFVGAVVVWGRNRDNRALRVAEAVVAHGAKPIGQATVIRRRGVCPSSGRTMDVSRAYARPRLRVQPTPKTVGAMGPGLSAAHMCSRTRAHEGCRKS
jgi:hypothetical protein